VQTFLPYKDFKKSLECLDYRRLGKQRVEAKQILNALKPDSKSRWRNHTAVKMWRGYENELICYHNLAILTWIGRGYNNNMPLLTVPESFSFETPPWITDEFCAAHRSNLLRKNFEWYSQFGWNEPDNLPYIWPTKL
jgi:hypothetical protein